MAESQPTDSDAEADRPTIEQLVDQLTGAGPDEVGPILTDSQADMIARRTVHGHGRQQAAEDLDVSVYTVDKHRRLANKKTESVADLGILLSDLDAWSDDADLRGLYDALAPLVEDDDEVKEDIEEDDEQLDDEILSRLDQLTETIECLSAQQQGQQPETEAAPEDATDDISETPDRSARLWGRLMMIDSVSQVDRRPGRPETQINLTNPTDDETDEVVDLIEQLGFEVDKYVPEFGGRDSDILSLVPATTDETDDVEEMSEEEVVELTEEIEQLDDDDSESIEETDDETDEGPTDAEVRAARGDLDAHTCHYCGDAFVVDDDSPDIVRSWNGPEADHPACSDCLADVAMGNVIDVLPEFRDRVEEQPDDQPDPSQLDDSDDVEEEIEEDDEDDEDDETEGYRCKDCGKTYPTGAALGGHRKSCPERIDNPDE